MRPLALALVLISASAWAAAPLPVDRLLSNLERASKNVHRLDGEFTQRTRVKLFKQELTSKGRISFSAPRRLKWEYLAPDPSTLLLDGNQATLSAPGAATRTFDLEKDATLRAVFDQLLLFLGPGPLAKAEGDYDPSSSGTADAPVLVLTPKAASKVAKSFRKIELRLDGRSWLLRSILLVEQSGDEKEIDFTSLRRR